MLTHTNLLTWQAVYGNGGTRYVAEHPLQTYMHAADVFTVQRDCGGDAWSCQHNGDVMCDDIPTAEQAAWYAEAHLLMELADDVYLQRNAALCEHNGPYHEQAAALLATMHDDRRRRDLMEGTSS